RLCRAPQGPYQGRRSRAVTKISRHSCWPTGLVLCATDDCIAVGGTRVVMRVTTLKVGAAGVGGLVAYYAKLVRDPGQGPVGYYVDPEEPPGRWWGAGCPAVGLEGEVVDGQLASMLEGQHPLAGKPLGRGYGDR